MGTKMTNKTVVVTIKGQDYCKNSKNKTKWPTFRASDKNHSALRTRNSNNRKTGHFVLLLLFLVLSALWFLSLALNVGHWFCSCCFYLSFNCYYHCFLFVCLLFCLFVGLFVCLFVSCSPHQVGINLGFFSLLFSIFKVFLCTRASVLDVFCVLVRWIHHYQLNNVKILWIETGATTFYQLFMTNSWWEDRHLPTSPDGLTGSWVISLKKCYVVTWNCSWVMFTIGFVIMNF